jgi:hypothetical protein
MNAGKVAGILLVIAGVLGLIYGGFSYTKQTQAAKIGPIELSVNEKQSVNVPAWVGAGMVVAGGLLLVFGGRTS